MVNWPLIGWLITFCMTRPKGMVGVPTLTTHHCVSATHCGVLKTVMYHVNAMIGKPPYCLATVC